MIAKIIIAANTKTDLIIRGIFEERENVIGSFLRGFKNRSIANK
jgi:hypothetical protein